MATAITEFYPHIKIDIPQCPELIIENDLIFIWLEYSLVFMSEFLFWSLRNIRCIRVEESSFFQMMVKLPKGDEKVE